MAGGVSGIALEAVIFSRSDDSAHACLYYYLCELQRMGGVPRGLGPCSMTWRRIQRGTSLDRVTTLESTRGHWRRRSSRDESRLSQGRSSALLLGETIAHGTETKLRMIDEVPLGSVAYRIGTGCAHRPPWIPLAAGVVRSANPTIVKPRKRGATGRERAVG